MEMVFLITACFIIIFKEITSILLVNKQLNNFNTLFLEIHKELINLNKEVSLFRNNLSSQNESIKDLVNENSTVNGKKEPNLIKSSQMTGIPIDKLAEIMKEENKLCSTLVTVKPGENTSEVNMKVDGDKIINNRGRW